MKLTIRSALHRAQEAEMRTAMASAVAESCEKIWHEHNPEDGVGGISRCPYRPLEAKEEAREAADKCDHLVRTHQFALETFFDENYA